MKPVPDLDDFRKLKAVPQRAVYWFCRNTQLDEGQHPVVLVWPGPKRREWMTMAEYVDADENTTVSEPDKDGWVDAIDRNSTQAVILREGEHFLTLRPDEIMVMVDHGFVIEEDGVWKPHPGLTWADWWVALEVEVRLRQKS